LKNDAKSTECVVQQFFIHIRVKVTDEDVGANVKVLLVCRGLGKETKPKQISKHFFNKMEGWACCAESIQLTLSSKTN
jgi:hypothetical protein